MQTLTIKNYTVLVDDEDYEALRAHTWNVLTVHGCIYITTSLREQKALTSMHMHTYIYRRHGLLQPHRNIKHRDGNTLNNTKANLTYATKTKQPHPITYTMRKPRSERRLSRTNTSGYTGVFFSTQKNHWVAQIFIHGKVKHLGIFGSAQEASQARTVFLEEHHL